jgi:hypothetical protein
MGPTRSCAGTLSGGFIDDHAPSGQDYQQNPNSEYCH